MPRPVPYPLRGDWAITAAGRDLVVGVWETAHASGKIDRLLAAIEARGGEPFTGNKRDLRIDRKVAILPVDGPLFRKAEGLADVSAATSYEWITKQCAAIRAARDAGEAQAAAIVFNTPGGEAAGMLACGEAIRALADEMHVEGYVETQASSAGWALASQCTRITAHRSAYVGSIGVRRMVTDTAGADDKAGIKNYEIISDGSPGKRSTPVDEDVLAREQRSVDDLMIEFRASVADGRGVSVETVLADYGQGDEMIASRALAVGMIDELGDLESVIARLGDGSEPSESAAASGTSQPGATSMRSDKARADADPKKDDDKDKAKAAAEPDKEAAKMVECSHCDGSGKMPDGSKCGTCGGTGEVEEGEARALDDKDDKDKAKAKEPDGDEGKKALAALSGLRPSASVAAHAEAIAARTVPNADFQRLNQRVAAVEAERKAERDAAHAAKCTALVVGAEARGYLAGLDEKAAAAKRASLLAVAKRDFEAAEMIIADLPAAKVEGRVTRNGNPLDGKHSATPRINAWDAERGGRRVSHGDIDTIERGSPDLMAKATAYAAANQCSIDDAMVAVVKADPALMQ